MDRKNLLVNLLVGTHPVVLALALAGLFLGLLLLIVAIVLMGICFYAACAYLVVRKLRETIFGGEAVPTTVAAPTIKTPRACLIGNAFDLTVEDDAPLV